MRRQGLETLLASRPSRQRDLVVAMVAARLLAPTSKLATTRWWHWGLDVSESLRVSPAPKISGDYGEIGRAWRFVDFMAESGEQIEGRRA